MAYLDTAVWQVSGGPTDRPYGENFLRSGVALIGPGEDGPWRSEQADTGSRGFVRRFSEELRAGDTLLLRTTVNTISAGFAPVAYANLDRLKQPAVVLFDRLRRT